jgi:hypothetical protein
MMLVEDMGQRKRGPACAFAPPLYTFSLDNRQNIIDSLLVNESPVPTIYHTALHQGHLSSG